MFGGMSDNLVVTFDVLSPISRRCVVWLDYSELHCKSSITLVVLELMILSSDYNVRRSRSSQAFFHVVTRRAAFHRRDSMRHASPYL